MDSAIISPSPRQRRRGPKTAIFHGKNALGRQAPGSQNRPSPRRGVCLSGRHPPPYPPGVGEKKPDTDFLLLCKRGTLQYCLIKPCTAALGLVLHPFGFYNGQGEGPENLGLSSVWQSGFRFENRRTQFADAHVFSFLQRMETTRT